MIGFLFLPFSSFFLSFSSFSFFFFLPSFPFSSFFFLFLFPLFLNNNLLYVNFNSFYRMAPLNAIVIPSASPSHPSVPPPNHLANERRRRTNARKAPRKFLVYPTDQFELHSNGTKSEKMKNIGTGKRPNDESEDDELKWEKKKRGKTTRNNRTEQQKNGTEKFDGTTMNGQLRRIELDEAEKNGLKTEQNGTAMNGAKMELDKKNWIWTRLRQQKRWSNGTRVEEEENERREDEEEQKQQNNGRNSASIHDELLTNGLRHDTDELSTQTTTRLDMDETGVSRWDLEEMKQYNVTDGVLMEEDKEMKQYNMTDGLLMEEDKEMKQYNMTDGLLMEEDKEMKQYNMTDGLLMEEDKEMKQYNMTDGLLMEEDKEMKQYNMTDGLLMEEDKEMKQYNMTDGLLMEEDKEMKQYNMTDGLLMEEDKEMKQYNMTDGLLMEEDKEMKQYNMTDGLLMEENTFESAADGQYSSSHCAYADEPLLQNGHQFHEVHSLCETPSSSFLRMSEEEGEKQEQKHQQHHQPNISSSLCTISSSYLATTVEKSYDCGKEIKAKKRRRFIHLEQFVEVPSVAVPWATTAHEQLGMRKSKVIMLGDSGVGKTSIVFSYKYGPNPSLLTSSPCNATIGASYTNFNMSVFNDVHVQLQIWDTAGQERFRCMVPLYMRNSNAAILVYDITNRESFEKVEQWHCEVMRCSNAVDEPVIVLIGNKADQQSENRTVTEEEGVEKACRLNAHFFEVSAVDSELIRSIFKLVAEKVVLQYANVENAREADEAMFVSGEQNERTTPTAAAAEEQRDDRSPVIRLGPEDAEGWAQQLLINCRSWWRLSDKRGTGNEELVPMGTGGKCCLTL